MKKIIAPIALIALLAACADSSHTTKITTDSSTEEYPPVESNDPYSSSDAPSDASATSPSDSSAASTSTAQSPAAEGEGIIAFEETIITTQTQSVPVTESNATAAPVQPAVTPAQTQPMVTVFPPANKQAETATNPNGYTLQILALSRKTNLTSYAAQLGKAQPVWMNLKMVKGSPWYTLLYGDFATPAEARAAIKTLPLEFQAYNPYVRSISSIKKSSNPELNRLN